MESILYVGICVKVSHVFVVSPFPANRLPLPLRNYVSLLMSSHSPCISLYFFVYLSSQMTALKQDEELLKKRNASASGNGIQILLILYRN